MRKHFVWASATLALVFAACGPSNATPPATSSPPCVNASAPHHAFVVVEHMSGASLQRCVGFAGDTIDGQKLMDQSAIPYQTQTFSFGKGVCQVDREPAQYSECFPKDGPFWALFVESGGAWADAQTGYAEVMLHDKEALGWHYVAASDAASPPPPPLAKE